jgi:hypothetical protein
MNRNFKVDEELGRLAELELERIIKLKLSRTKVEKMPWEKVGYDLKLTAEYDGVIVTQNIEVKSLAGGYATGVIEQWADDKRTRRPHWMKMGDTDRIYFFDRSKNYWFVYDAKEVAQWIEIQPESNLRALNNNEDDSGWILKFYWDGVGTNDSYKMPGFIKKFKGERK